ncbi:MAG: hypothetical protein HW411_400 [Gammaproteobacteria bacterium]|nr:hypothetical protein [Gammaproteobacteria bacterium]
MRQAVTVIPVFIIFKDSIAARPGFDVDQVPANVRRNMMR